MKPFWNLVVVFRDRHDSIFGKYVVWVKGQGYYFDVPGTKYEEI